MTMSEEGLARRTRVVEIVDDVAAALRDVIRKHRVTADEYRAAVAWLTWAGEQEAEIALLLDVYLAATVDDVQTAMLGGTDSNTEGPFYIPDAPLLTLPYVLPRRVDEPGEVLVFSGSVTSTEDVPLAGALVDVWQDNGAGEYSHFHSDVPENNLRGRLVTDADGRFELETVMPVAYEIPKSGATGHLLAATGRPAFRPAHMHFKISHASARPLTTQVYFEGDPWLDDDVIGAVRAPLVTKVVRSAEDAADQRARCSYDFVLPPIGERGSQA